MRAWLVRHPFQMYGDLLPSTAAAVIASVLLSGCTQYATVSTTRPSFPQASSQLGSSSPTDQRIAKALAEERSIPQAALADFLAAAETASRELSHHPDDRTAREAYNFAVARVFTVLKLEQVAPWSQPVRVPAAGGDYLLACEHDPRPEYNPALYDLTPVDELKVKGTYVAAETFKPGLGAPLIAVSKESRQDAASNFTLSHTYYGLTALLRFDAQRRCTLFFRDPLQAETVDFGGHTFPLAANFTVPLAVVLAREHPKKLELARALHPDEYAKTARIVRLQPYDPNKTVVLFVHGLIDTAATWVPMMNTLRGDPEIRRHYQFWFYSYPSGYPYPYAAVILRDQLDAVEKRYPLHHKIVLVGHSMGSLISRLMITDSGDKLWLAYFGKPPAQTPLSPRSRATLEHTFIFHHRAEVSRVIFISGPHRGSELATGGLGRFGASLIRTPSTLLAAGNDMRKAVTTGDTGKLRLNRIPNSVDTLAPNDRFVEAISTVPITPGIPYHSIVGDRGKGGNNEHTAPTSTDGVVPYWSSHLDGAQSELIVPSNHSAHQNPQAIAEVDRILRLNVGVPTTFPGTR